MACLWHCLLTVKAHSHNDNVLQEDILRLMSPSGVHVLVGTPGRGNLTLCRPQLRLMGGHSHSGVAVLDLAHRRVADLSKCATIVLDEVYAVCGVCPSLCQFCVVAGYLADRPCVCVRRTSF